MVKKYGGDEQWRIWYNSITSAVNSLEKDLQRISLSPKARRREA